MSGYEDMKRLFEGADLGVPPVPKALRPDVHEVRPWTYATFDVAANDLYDIDSGLQTMLDRRENDSFAVGHVGHGINSYAIGYQVVTGSFIVVLQLAWGGVYMDMERATDAVRRSFDPVGSLLSLQAPADVADGHLLVVSSDFAQLQAFGWLSPGELVDVRAWKREHATAEAVEAARAWAVEEGWASRPSGDEADDRFVWRPGDVTTVRKGDRSEEDPQHGRETPKIRVPSPDLPWGQEVIEFALSYNGYDRHGGNQGAAAIANPLLAPWHEKGVLDADLPTLRCALFFEQRRAHHSDRAPDPDYLAALLTAIQHQSGGWVDGPSDPYP